jgi:hypothetical protein
MKLTNNSIVRNLIIFSSIVFVSLGCDTAKPPAPFRLKFEECLKLIGRDFTEGSAVVGAAEGAAHLYIYQNVTDDIDEWRLRVNYKVFIPIVSEVSDQYMEDGNLKNFRLEQGKYFGAKQLCADWTPTGSGPGKFAISIIKNRKSEYVVYVGIQGSSWNYFDNIKLDKATLDKLIVLLEGKPTVESESIDPEPQHELSDSLIEEIIDSTQYGDGDDFTHFICTTDYLRLREDSNANSQILEYIRLNEVLFNLNVRSERVDTVTINGETNVWPWHYVESKKGNKGWVNGCCVQYAED